MKRMIVVFGMCVLCVSLEANAAGGDKDDDIDRRGSSVTSDDRPGNGGLSASGSLGSDKWIDPADVPHQMKGDPAYPSVAHRDRPLPMSDTARDALDRSVGAQRSDTMRSSERTRDEERAREQQRQERM